MKHGAAFLLVGIGGFLGSVSRYSITLLLSPFAGGFPYATFAVNLVGSFLIGLLTGLTVSAIPLSSDVKLFLVTGFCGGFTTFSAYMYDNALLLRDGHQALMLLYLIGSIAGGFLSLWLGMVVARALSS